MKFISKMACQRLDVDIKTIAFKNVIEYYSSFFSAFISRLEYGAVLYDLALNCDRADCLDFGGVARAYNRLKNIIHRDPLIFLRKLSDFILETSSVLFLNQEIRDCLINKVSTLLVSLLCCNAKCRPKCICLSGRFDSILLFSQTSYDHFLSNSNTNSLAYNFCGPLIRGCCSILEDIDRFIPPYQECFIAAKEHTMDLLIDYGIFFTVTFNGQVPYIIVENNQERLLVTELKNYFFIN